MMQVRRARAPSFLRRRRCGEFLQQSLLERHKIGGQRHAGGAQLVQLLMNLQVKLVQIFRLVVHLAEKQANLRLQFFECHDITSREH